MTINSSSRSRLRSTATVATLAIAACIATACTSAQPTKVTSKRSKEYFAESEYGVKASPRVTTLASNLPRGGGRDQIGKPYTVRGKVYYPKEVKDYKKTGIASWYGDAFHGRLTANGEIYDKTHLTAAHPTMPLPSYARVTNTANGSSVIVRVNDRGPYSHNRLIDLSKRAAEMLDYTHTGTAKVQVEYVGRAPLDGQDEAYLMASYRPGGRAPDPSDGMPTGVMIAMNGPTPTTNVGAPANSPFGMAEMSSGMSGAGPSGLELPSFGPIAPERPEFGQMRVASLSYAPAARATSAFSSFDALSSGQGAPLGANAPVRGSGQPYVAAGSFTDAREAEKLAGLLSAYGYTEIDRTIVDGQTWYSVNLIGRGTSSLDELLKAAWSHGAPEAIAVRD